MATPGHIQVKVIVDGKPIQEYEESKDENPEVIAKYIEATSGAEFELNIVVLNSFRFTSDALLFEVSLDGTYVRGEFCINLRGSYQSLFHWDHTLRGITTQGANGRYLRPFIFNEIKSLEDASLGMGKLQKETVDALGSITVKVFRATMKHNHNGNIRRISSKGLGKITEIAEKQLKGANITHTTKLGEKQSCNPWLVVDADYTDDGDSPIASFEFRYCSRGALQAMLLIPRTPSPVPLDQRPVEEWTLEELRETARKHIASRSQGENQRQAKSEPEVEPARGVKREHDKDYDEAMRSGCVKKSKANTLMVEKEIIDLCGDD